MKITAIITLFLTVYLPLSAAPVSSIRQWIPSADEKTAVARELPDRVPFFDRAFEVYTGAKAVEKVFVISPDAANVSDAQPTLIIWKDWKIISKAAFPSAVRGSSLKKIEFVSYQDINADGINDLLFIAQFTPETGLEPQKAFSAGIIFLGDSHGGFTLDGENYYPNTNTIADLKSKTRSSRSLPRLSAFSIETGMCYGEAKQKLEGLGWNTLPAQSRRPNPNFPEISCGQGISAVCSASFQRKKEEIVINLRDEPQCAERTAIDFVGDYETEHDLGD